MDAALCDHGFNLPLQDHGQLLRQVYFLFRDGGAYFRVNEYLIWLPEPEGGGVQSHEFFVRFSTFMTHYDVRSRKDR